ncbi:hypothetical protein GUJ93_ZPchr0005g15350 [Zizania palustris]|uniref:Uncharacterized protein n=1 Tax=Zizania palustris TaxID=103762 RepID=A0A8J5SSN1_ZIZPA|nr:hypothetical protein GUJ93_ZPchr0005g15350 [Zizania palustris]
MKPPHAPVCRTASRRPTREISNALTCHHKARVPTAGTPVLHPLQHARLLLPLLAARHRSRRPRGERIAAVKRGDRTRRRRQEFSGLGSPPRSRRSPGHLFFFAATSKKSLNFGTLLSRSRGYDKLLLILIKAWPISEVSSVQLLFLCCSPYQRLHMGKGKVLILQKVISDPSVSHR